MAGKVNIRRLSTGVPGLDDVLGGGLPEFSFNLIAGLPGCGKTTLAHQLMFALARSQCRALYFTVLGEPPLKMLRYQQQFSFFEMQALDGAVAFVNLGDLVLAGDLEAVLARIAAEVLARGLRAARPSSSSIPSARWPPPLAAMASAMKGCNASSSSWRSG